MLLRIRKIMYLQIMLFFSYSVCFAQPNKSFVVVHCDPNEAYNFPNLEVLVDSANAYNIKLTIEFTAPWIDSILPYQIRLNKIMIWQSQGHEIGLHHHEITAKGIWDRYSNFSMAEIHNAGRDTNLLIGNTDSLYNLAQRVSQIPIYTVGVEDSTALPTQASYQTRGHDIPHGYSNPFSFSVHNRQYCRLSHCIVDTVFKTQQLTAQYPLMTGMQVIGVNTHVYNFVDDPMSLISYFQFLNTNGGILSLTVSEILGNCFLVGQKEINDRRAIESWPNPVEETLFVKTERYFDQIKVYDLTGHLIEGISFSKGEQIEINVSGLQAGLYFLKLSNKNDHAMLKFIKK